MKIKRNQLKDKIIKVLMILVILSLIPLLLVLSNSNIDDGVIIEDEIKKEMERLDEINQYPNKLDIDPLDYPKEIGIYNGKMLIEEYHCSDVCPDNAVVLLFYKDVESKEECDQLGGKAEIDIAWGSTFLGCSPKID